MPLDPVLQLTASNQLDTPHPPLVEEEIGFEEIQKQMGIMLILVSKERRNFYHHQSEIYDKAYKVQVEKHVETYRGFGPLAYTVVKCGQQIAKLAIVFVPEDVRNFVTTVIPHSETAVDTIKQLFDNSVGANRTEAAAHAEQSRSLAEQKRQEHQKYLSEEAEAIRKFEQQRNKQDDFMLSMARGG